VLAAVNATCTLGLDLGTSSAKAVVTDTGGRVLSQASAGYAVTSARAGYAESEPADWWRAVTACAREAVTAAARMQARPDQRAASVDVAGHALTGAALRPKRDDRGLGRLPVFLLQRRLKRTELVGVHSLAPLGSHGRFAAAKARSTGRFVQRWPGPRPVI